MSEGQAPPQRPPPPEKEDSASSHKSGFGFRSMMDSMASEAMKVTPKVQSLGGRLKHMAPPFPSRSSHSSHSHTDDEMTPDESSQPQETATRNQDKHNQDEENSANSSEEEGEEEDYAAMLENMDIDGDFTAWTSFRQSVRTLQVENDDGGGNANLNDDSMIPPTISEDSSSSYNESNDLAKWKARYEHLPVFSKYYQPTPQERKEMDELKQLLGISRLIPATPMERGVAELWSDQDGQPQSILLKRGPVAFQKEERELILVTRGLILAKVQDQKRGAWGRGGWIRRTFDQYIPLHTISKVLDGSIRSTNEHSEHDPTSLTLQTSSVDSNGSSMDPVSWTFTCASVPHQVAWLEALQVAVVQAHLLHETKWVVDENLHLGWKHRVMCSSLYTAAILGNANMMNELLQSSVSTKVNVNAPDDDGISALHYATRYMKLNCMETLLEAKANPNVLDTDSHTPMHYAVEANFQAAVDLLLAFGAAPPYDNGGGSDSEGELFGKVAREHAVDQEHKQVVKAEAVAAEAANNLMAENMQLMKERGEKLENMDDKASQVRQDAEEMKQLSHQLKEKMKKKNTWFGL